MAIRSLILGACPDEKLRNGLKARELASTACVLTKGRDTDCLASLAVACAETGDYEEACRLQKRILSMVDGRTGRVLHESRLALFLTHRPYRLMGPSRSLVGSERKKNEKEE
jgi:hypothetical protein